MGRVAHPIMFDDNDPLLGKVRAIAATFPEFAEKISHGRPAFFTKKIFAYYGGSIRDDGLWVQHPQAIIVLTDAQERAALLDDERSFVPAYLGAYGWIGIDLTDSSDWDEITELIDASYRLTAPKRAVALLDS